MRLFVESIGEDLAASPQERQANRQKITDLEHALSDKREVVAQGWGEKYVKRVHAKGKLTTNERIERLIDKGTEIFPVGTSSI